MSDRVVVRSRLGARARGWLRAASVVLALSGLAPSVAAGPPEGPTEAEREVARRKYADGEKAFDQKRYRDAVELFLDADRIIADPAFAFNLSETYHALNDSPRALRWAREYLKRAPDAPDRADMEARVATEEQALKKQGVQQITITSSPPGAVIAVDGRGRGPSPWTGELSPGTHILDMKLQGYRDVRRPFDLGADHAMDLAVPLESLVAEPVPTVAPVPVPVVPVPAPAVEPVERPPLLPIGIATFGAGAASLVAALGLEIARARAEQDARDATIQLDALSAADSMDSFQLGARVALGLGVGLCAVGGTLVAVDLATAPEGGADEGDSSPVTGWLGCGPAGCVARLSLP
ncbi:MAG: PEGA domain-containing protein [Polyangiaceae bacterium]|nr:PEGA domain-containing protein [Polyangiaceae bacterium]